MVGPRPRRPGTVLRSAWTPRSLLPAVVATVRRPRRASPGIRRPPATHRRLQWLGPARSWCGIAQGGTVTLQVRGHRPGPPRHARLIRVGIGRERFLLTLTGDTERLRAALAAGHPVLIGRLRRSAARLVEVPVAERVPVFRVYLLPQGAYRRRRGWYGLRVDESRFYFGLGDRPSLEEIRSIAERYPVFRVVDP